MSRRRWPVSLAVAVSLVALTGCGDKPAGDPNTTDPKVLFDMHCARCHAQAGEPGGPPAIGSSKGPNLSKIGGEPGHTAEWLAEYIRDPKSKKPDPKLMPAFGDKLSDAQIKSLADYFAAKK